MKLFDNFFVGYGIGTVLGICLGGIGFSYLSTFQPKLTELEIARRDYISCIRLGFDQRMCQKEWAFRKGSIDYEN